MLAVSCVSQSEDDPLSGVAIGEQPAPEPKDGWVRVSLRASALNHHDLWSLRGVGLAPDRLPMILGCDGAGVLDDGTEVVVHSVIGDPAAGGGDETLDPSALCCPSSTRERWPRRSSSPSGTWCPNPPGCRSRRRPASDRLADRVSHVDDSVGTDRTGHDPRPRGGRGCRHRRHHLGQGSRAHRLLHLPGRHQASAGRGIRCRCHLRDRRPAPEQGRFRRGDRGPGDLVPFAAVAPSRWAGRGERRHQWGQPAGRSEPGLLPAARGGRFDHGHSRRAGRSSDPAETTGACPVIHNVRPLADARSALQEMADGDVFGKLVLTP